ncbi:PREDICTED: uncharacterized protein LOC105148200 [Acromyrmex echinatior]|uniref:uncharacterized protein LOC105148200 n=1 Tax=Acromyrmex echinatior TaxID=103372 RepID=UPI000580C7C3|nr:PREDICTED: uncharacterized protein LOC105148200 [Acromyrmex echinatior]
MMARVLPSSSVKLRRHRCSKNFLGVTNGIPTSRASPRIPLDCISSFLKRSPYDRVTKYARDRRIGRTRLAGPAGRRTTLSNLRSIFHSRNSFAIQFSDMCTTCCVEPASVAGDQIGVLKFSSVQTHPCSSFSFYCAIIEEWT